MVVALVIIFMVIGFVFSAFLVKSKWNFYASDPFGFNLMSLRNANRLARVWPMDEKFLSLHFSMLRHMIVGLVSIAIMYIFGDGIAAQLMPFVNLLYALSKIPVYMARRKDFADSGESVKGILIPVKKACLITVVYGFYVYFVSMVFYAIR